MGFIGKLAKMAAGVKQTHVEGSKVDMGFLAGLAEQSGAGAATIREIRRANTARHVSKIVQNSSSTGGFFDLICAHTYRHMRKHCNDSVPIEVVLFDFDGSILARSDT